MFAKIFRRRERGQILAIAALMAPILLGMTAMAVDIGGYASERRTLQNAADSIALAAVQELCKTNCNTYGGDQAAATTQANVWAAKNGINTGDMTVTFPGSASDPRVRVSISKPHTFSFIQVLGVGSKTVAASAMTAKVSIGGSSGIVPWSVTQATVDTSPYGQLITLKYDTNANPSPGNYGAIRIDGPGANTYRASAMYGSTTVACAISAANCTTGACPGTYPATCSENSPECDGPECSPQTGNMVGPTRTAVDFRMTDTAAACDTFAETFSGPDAAGRYHLNSGCNPWNGGGLCATQSSICSRRVIIIPVVDAFGNGQTPVTIQRFALVYLEGYDNGKCQGNSCEIHGRFVNADLTVNALAGSYDPGASVHFVKLIE